MIRKFLDNQPLCLMNPFKFKLFVALTMLPGHTRRETVSSPGPAFLLSRLACIQSTRCQMNCGERDRFIELAHNKMIRWLACSIVCKVLSRQTHPGKNVIQKLEHLLHLSMHINYTHTMASVM